MAHAPPDGVTDRRVRAVVLELVDGSGGARLDRFLAARSEVGVTRSRLTRLFREGGVRAQGKPVRASAVLEGRVRIELRLPLAEEASLAPEAIPLQVLYEDIDLAVVDKPSGLVVHPGAGRSRGTLAHALVHRYPELAGAGPRPGIVHRLDAGTSGLLVVARNEGTRLALQADVARHEVGRVYHALVLGPWSEGTGRLSAPVGRDPHRRTRMAVLPGGRPAATRWRRLFSTARASLLELILETGRTHQIRVHLQHAGAPVLGDPVYGPRGAPPAWLARLRLARPMLHAAQLTFRHPRTGVRIEVDSRWPDDFRNAAAALGFGTAARRFG